MQLVQIVPELPPAVGGIGDYASLLAKELHRRSVVTTFVIPERRCPESQPGRLAEGPEASPVAPRPGALAERLDRLRPDAVLLHYSGYGYAQRGAPLWLVHGLHRWKRSARAARLVVMFHEVCTESRAPWRCSFWLSQIRRLLAQALAGLADACVTSCLHYERLLRQLRPGLGEIPVLPVPSNVGEPAEMRPFLDREPVAVVFGQARRRLDVYRSMPEFLPLLQRAGIRALEDIGPQLPAGAYDALPWPVRVHGVTPPEQVSDLLGRTRFGLLRLPSHLLEKSGCFAAFAAHGTVCLLRDDGGSAAGQLLDGGQFIGIPSLASEALDERDFETIASAAFRWYARYRAGNSAERLARALFQCAC